MQTGGGISWFCFAYGVAAVCVSFFEMLGVKSRALRMLDRCSVEELSTSAPKFFVPFFLFCLTLFYFLMT